MLCREVQPRGACVRMAVLFALLAVAALAGACREQHAAPPPQAVEVTAFEVHPRTVTIHRDYVGEIAASQEVQIRPQVGGIVQEVLFTDGSIVKKGQPLYTIDTRTYKAMLANAKAKLAQAEANHIKARQDVDRYGPLVQANAIDRRTYDNAVAQEKQTREEVNAMQAAVEQAQIDLGYTTIRSPVTGRVGRTLLDVGGLAERGTTLLTTISVKDPVYVYFNISERDYLELSRRCPLFQDESSCEARFVRLILADGSVYPAEGRVHFADRALSQQTGTLKMRAVFPNTDDLLIPGLYARVRFDFDQKEDALLVPQKSVTEMFGKRFVTVVGPEGKAENRPVQMGERLDSGWIVDEGVKPGEKVVVDGVIKAVPGALLNATLLDETQAFGGPRRAAN